MRNPKICFAKYIYLVPSFNNTALIDTIINGSDIRTSRQRGRITAKYGTLMVPYFAYGTLKGTRALWPQRAIRTGASVTAVEGLFTTLSSTKGDNHRQLRNYIASCQTYTL